MKENNGLKEHLSKDDEIFAKNITMYLGKQPNVSNRVANRLEEARVLAISQSNISSVPVMKVTAQEEAQALGWFKKQSMPWLNGVLALSLFICAPLGFELYESQTEFSPIQQVKFLTTDNDYLENVYHQDADDLPDDYLKDNGFI